VNLEFWVLGWFQNLNPKLKTNRDPYGTKSNTGSVTCCSWLPLMNV